MLAGVRMEHAKKLNSDLVAQLRQLAHDLSNSIETVIQASYLLNQTKLEPQGRKWARMIGTAADEAAHINRSLRELLRQSGKTQIVPSEKSAPKRRAS